MFGKLLYGSKFHRLPMSRTGSKHPPHDHEINIDTAHNKPHPYGAELGMLIKMLQATPHRTLQGCMTTEFARIKVWFAKEHCSGRERLLKAINATKLMRPPATISSRSKCRRPSFHSAIWAM